MQTGSYDIVAQISEKMVNKALSIAYYLGKFPLLKGKYTLPVDVPADLRSFTDIDYEVMVSDPPVYSGQARGEASLRINGQCKIIVLGGIQVGTVAQIQIALTPRFSQADHTLALNFADIIVVSAGGYPSDINLYQAHKALDNALDAVKRGGVIILVAECLEGHGNDVFYDWMTRLPDLKSMEKEVKRNFVMGGHKAYYLLKALQTHPIILVSSMPDFYATSIFKVKTARAVNDALAEALKIAGSSARVWAMPQGGYTLPIYKAAEEDKT